MMLFISDGSDSYYLDIWDNKELHFFLKDDSTLIDEIVGTTKDLNDDLWHQAVAVRNAEDGKLYLYLDGQSDATPISATNTTGRSIAPAADLAVGKYGNGFRLHGSLSLVEMAGKAWSAEDVLQSFEAEKGLFGR